MTLSWSLRRKLVYSGVTLFVALVVVVYVWVRFFTAAPTCFDGKQDGTETGVDCGGSCSLVCSDAAKAPVVLWARAFSNSDHTYAAAAYVQNNNGNAAARGVHYAFQFYDASNKLIIERDGTFDIPPVETMPVVEPSIDVGNRQVAHVQFSIDDTYPLVWDTVPAAQIPSLRTSAQQLSRDATRLDATIENNSIFDAPNVTLVAVLFDASGVARAASKSLVPVVPHKSSTHVVFTWPQAVAGIVRTDITILPSF